MCKYCNIDEDEEIDIIEDRINLGLAGDLLNQVLIKRYDEDAEFPEEKGWFISSDTFHVDADIDDIKVLKVRIKFCPFCGREL